jgi:hypothetical protein
MKIKHLALSVALGFLVGCGGGGGSAPPIDVSSAKNLIPEDADYLSSLKICNDSASTFNIVDVRSNPTTSTSDGPNRISKEIPPGKCAELHTDNCDQDYIIDITYSDGAYWRNTYFRECGYEHIFNFYY